MEELQKAIDIKTVNQTDAIDILHSIGKLINTLRSSIVSKSCEK